MFDIISVALIIQLFVLLNPLTTVPYLISAHKKKFNMKSIAYKASLTAFAIALVIALTGPKLFNFFGVSIESFKIAGGLILLLLSIEMVREEAKKAEFSNIDGFISLLATPLLTGPATISFIIIKSFELSPINLVANILVTFILVWISLYLLAISISRINEKVINISSRIFGLLLAAISIEMILSGLSAIILKLR